MANQQQPLADPQEHLVEENVANLVRRIREEHDADPVLVPNAAPEAVADSATEATATAALALAADAAPEAVDDAVSEVVTDAAAETWADAHTEVVADAATEVVADATAEDVADAVTEVVADAATEAAFDDVNVAVADASTEVVAEVASEIVAIATAEDEADTTTEIIAESIDELPADLTTGEPAADDVASIEEDEEEEEEEEQEEDDNQLPGTPEDNENIPHEAAEDDPGSTYALEELIAPLNEQARETDWATFEQLLQDITEKVRSHLHIRQPEERATQLIDVDNCKSLQKLYRNNRRRAVRAILDGETERCQIPNTTIVDHFKRIYTAKEFDRQQLDSVPLAPPNRTQPSTDPFPEQTILRRLTRAENTSP